MAFDHTNSDTRALTGAATLAKQLRALGALEEGKALRRAGTKVMRIIIDRAKALVPVGTRAHKTYKGRTVSPGFAQRSIKGDVLIGSQKNYLRVTVGVTNEAFYAVQFVERGTKKMTARPWLEPAFASTVNAQEQAVMESLEESIIKATQIR